MASRGQRRAAQFPQLGVDPQFYHKTDRSGALKYTDAGNPALGFKWPLNEVDFSDPAQALAAASNYDLAIRSASPSTRSSGEQWYPRVNEAVGKGVREGRNFLSSQANPELAGAGLVAAVSPNMDWESNNIDALGEMARMNTRQWDAVMHGTPQEHSDAVRGLSISASSRPNLQKAGRLVQGEDPEVVLSRQTAPKTNSFMRNIYDPAGSSNVTVDGRAFDTLVNRALPWEQGRGISSAANVSGSPTRYEQAESIMRNVASEHGLSPSAGQAVAWESVKQDVEKLGGQRSQGPSRLGQAIFDPHSGLPVMHEGAREMRQKKTAAIRSFAR